jgi:hypothetical protein
MIMEGKANSMTGYEPGFAFIPMARICDAFLPAGYLVSPVMLHCKPLEILVTAIAKYMR